MQGYELDPTRRFTDRVADYVRYRPDYPAGVIEVLRGELGLTEGSAVADVGSGTGILSRMLLDAGGEVWGVEPNAAMRAAADLAGSARFHSMKGTAEATTLADRSVDFVTAGQAFHWFEPAATRREFARILRPGGWVVLVWNERRRDGSAFARAYEALVRRYGTDYAKVVHRENASLVKPFFAGASGFQKRTFEHVHTLDFDGLRGRLASSSYIPKPGHADYEAMIAALAGVFDAHHVEGRVRMEYDTDVYFGQLG